MFVRIECMRPVAPILLPKLDLMFGMACESTSPTHQAIPRQGFGGNT